MSDVSEEESSERGKRDPLQIHDDPQCSPDEYTDGRAPWDWEARYKGTARDQINFEAKILVGILVALLVLTGLTLSLSSQLYFVEVFGGKLWISNKFLSIFFVGCLGGTTFSLKWLVHSVAVGRWHMDRRYWRLIVPILGGVYSCVVITLFGSGILSLSGPQVDPPPAPVPATAALAFLVGYFSDGVSGLLSNVANAVFGTLEKK